MKIVVLYHEAGEDSTIEDRDVLVQRDAVATALHRLGHETFCLSCTLNLATVKQQLISLDPDVVFNLVESLGGTDRLMTLATMLLDSLPFPYTGAQTDAILATSNKLTAKQRMQAAGLPTPALRGGTSPMVGGGEVGRSILKPVSEHASFGIDDKAVVTANDFSTLDAKLRDRERQIGRPLFAEQFIEGREFNLSLLRGHVLPPAEIDFSTFPPQKPRIVGHSAKWDEDSFEFQQTPRNFTFPATDAPLLGRVSDLARMCWRLFDLRGYARVDFRIDSEGQSWILDVNANPCLSPDAGFAAALSRGGITYDEAVQQIIDDSPGGTCQPAEWSQILAPRM